MRSPVGRAPTESEMKASRDARSNANTFFQISGFSMIEIRGETSGCVRASIWLNEIVPSDSNVEATRRRCSF